MYNVTLFIYLLDIHCILQLVGRKPKGHRSPTRPYNMYLTIPRPRQVTHNRSRKGTMKGLATACLQGIIATILFVQIIVYIKDVIDELHQSNTAHEYACL